MNAQTAIAKPVEVSPPAVVTSYSDSILAIIAQAARDPNVDIDKMERLLAMQERVQARDSKIAFTTAFADMQPELPIIDRKGRITITDKNDREKVIQSTAFAKWEDINEAIVPILHRHRFALSFKPGMAPDGRVTVTAILRHVGGHEDEATFTLPHDSSGSKNAVQAIGSSNSYGKRYAACDVLNITTRGQDDDGEEAGAPQTVSDTELARLQQLASDAGADLPKFCRYMKVSSLKDLPANRFNEAVEQLRRKAVVK